VENIVRGVSIHFTGSGLQYYIHYDKAGTKEVNEKEYYQAVYLLEQMKTGEHEKQKVF
jgi:hypothetical protein